MRASKKTSSTLFWKSVNGKRSQRPKLPVVQLGNGTLSSDLTDRKRELDNHLKTKFKTSYEEVREEQLQIDDTIFTSTRSFTNELSENLNSLIEKHELSWAINSLKEDKAPGVDKITPKMVLNTPNNWRTKLLVLFRNIQKAGKVPKNWKDGKVVLLLKKTPATIMANYRPITLISVLSKLLTKILAKRMSDAIVEEDVIGPEQNGFRPGRGCGDNLFILNTLVERHEQTKSLNLCFIDLKAAYDSVNRQILWKRMEKLNVPKSLIALLKDYYCDVNITYAV
jgi:hypothetical protein